MVNFLKIRIIKILKITSRLLIIPMKKQLEDSEKVLQEFVITPYKYGFKTDIENETFPKGLNQEIVKKISGKKSEPEFLKKFRLKSKPLLV